MTLFGIEIHVPTVTDGAYSMIGLWNALAHLLPSIASNVVSFTVLAMYWTSHHASFHFFTKTVNRTLLQFNMLYLMLLAFFCFIFPVVFNLVPGTLYATERFFGVTIRKQVIHRNPSLLFVLSW